MSTYAYIRYDNVYIHFNRFVFEVLFLVTFPYIAFRIEKIKRINFLHVVN